MCTALWRLSKACKERGFTKRAFSNALRLHGRLISRANGYRIFDLERIPLDLLADCCAVLKCSPADLLVLVDTKPALLPPPAFEPPGVH